MESKRNSKASPSPLPVYKYSSSLVKRAEENEAGIRMTLPMFCEGEGEAALNGDGEREEKSGRASEKEDWAGNGVVDAE